MQYEHEHTHTSRTMRTRIPKDGYHLSFLSVCIILSVNSLANSPVIPLSASDCFMPRPTIKLYLYFNAFSNSFTYIYARTLLWFLFFLFSSRLPSCIEWIVCMHCFPLICGWMHRYIKGKQCNLTMDSCAFFVFFTFYFFCLASSHLITCSELINEIGNDTISSKFGCPCPEVVNSHINMNMLWFKLLGLISFYTQTDWNIYAANIVWDVRFLTLQRTPDCLSLFDE